MNVRVQSGSWRCTAFSPGEGDSRWRPAVDSFRDHCSPGRQYPVPEQGEIEKPGCFNPTGAKPIGQCSFSSLRTGQSRVGQHCCSTFSSARPASSHFHSQVLIPTKPLVPQTRPQCLLQRDQPAHQAFSRSPSFSLPVCRSGWGPGCAQTLSWELEIWQQTAQGPRPEMSTCKCRVNARGGSQRVTWG